MGLHLVLFFFNSIFNAGWDFIWYFSSRFACLFVRRSNIEIGDQLPFPTKYDLVVSEIIEFKICLGIYGNTGCGVFKRRAKIFLILYPPFENSTTLIAILGMGHICSIQ